MILLFKQEIDRPRLSVCRSNEMRKLRWTGSYLLKLPRLLCIPLPPPSISLALPLSLSLFLSLTLSPTLSLPSSGSPEWFSSLLHASFRRLFCLPLRLFPGTSASNIFLARAYCIALFDCPPLPCIPSQALRPM